MLAAPSNDGDDAAPLEQLEHERHLSAAPPLVGVARHHQVGLDLTREQRPVPLELAQQVALETRVGFEELRAEAKTCSKSRLKEIYQQVSGEIMTAIAKLELCEDKTTFP